MTQIIVHLTVYLTFYLSGRSEPTMNSTILIGSGCFSVDFNKLWLSCLSFLQTSMNVPALKQTSVTPTLSVATLKDRIPVAVVLGIREMEKAVQVNQKTFLLNLYFGIVGTSGSREAFHVSFPLSSVYRKGTELKRCRSAYRYLSY